MERGKGEEGMKMEGKGVKKMMRNGMLMIVILLLLVLIFNGTASAKALPVDGGTDFTKIPAAVDVASDSNTIIVHTDTYSENADLNKRLPLQSEHGAVSTIVQSVLIILLMMLLLRFMKTLYIQAFIQ